TTPAETSPLLVAVSAPAESPVMALSAQRRTGPGTLAALLESAWVLVGPLAIGLGLTILLWLQGRRAARANRVWAAAERRFRMAVEAAKCGVWEWNLSRGEVSLSDFMAALLGLPKGGETSAETVLQSVHPRHRERVQHALRQAAAYGVFEVSFRVDAPDGAVRWIDARGHARGERGREGYRQIMGVAMDVTEARVAKARAQAAEIRLRDAIESVTDAFVLFDRHGRLVLWNQAFQDAFSFESRALRAGAAKDQLNQIAA